MRLSEVAKASSISALPKDEQQQLVARKKKARRYSQIGGTLGLAALATRAPQGVKAATAHTPSLRVRRPVRRLIAMEPRATNTSNTLTTLGAGIGAMGSFNFAGMQRSEAKADEKQIKVRKRDDAFLRRYRNRISPKAEEGYQHLREGRNQARVDAGGYGALAAGNAASGAKLLRRHPVMAGASIGSAVVLGQVARERGRKAKGWEAIMQSHIRNRAYQRERDGQWGKDRLVETSKAMFPTGLVKPLVRPKSPGYATRTGGIVRRGAKTYTRRGSIAGSVGGTR